MNTNEKSYDLIKFEDGDFSLDVKVSPNEDTVWLTQEQMAQLFNVDRTRILRHINNIYKEKEIDIIWTCAESAQVQFEGKRQVKRIVKLYNLDVIIAVGYRVNSKRGTLFRKWANTILKQYLLNGYVVNSDRIIAYQSNILQLESSFINIENRVKSLEETVYQDNDKLIYEGDIIEPIKFLKRLFHLAKNDITITDYYADSFLISLLENVKISITIITSNSSYLNKENVKDNIRIIKNDTIHGRYIFIDDNSYVIDNSFNAIGKKRFVIVKLDDITKEMILKDIL